MRKKSFLLLVTIIITTAVTVGLFGCTTTLAVPDLDGSIALMSGADITSKLSANPDRGLRYELYITLSPTGNTLASTRAFPNKYLQDKNGESYQETAGAYLEKQLSYYMDNGGFGYNMAQVYVYLCDFISSELPNSALAQLKAYFELLKSKKLRAVLRFAYEYDETAPKGPTSETMFRHMEQLGAWLKQTAIKNLADGVVSVWQEGFVGVWGEGHTSEFPHDQKEVLSHFVNMVPAGGYMQVRTSQIRNAAPRAATSRIGYHDDFEIGAPNIWSAAGANTRGSDYKTFIKQSPALLNDGEMPWGAWSVSTEQTVGPKPRLVDGLAFIKSMYEHRYNTFSAAHNFIENGHFGEYSMDGWRFQYITAADLDKIGVPYFPTYFGSKDAPVSRTVYDYVADHLGYLLVASNKSVTDTPVITETDKNGNNISYIYSNISFTISNFGMAAPLNIKGFEVVFGTKRADGTIRIIDKSTSSSLAAFEKSVLEQWTAPFLQNYQTKTITLKDIQRNPGFAIGIKIYLSDNNLTPIRLANDIPFLGGTTEKTTVAGVNWIHDFEQLL